MSETGDGAGRDEIRTRGSKKSLSLSNVIGRTRIIVGVGQRLPQGANRCMCYMRLYIRIIQSQQSAVQEEERERELYILASNVQQCAKLHCLLHDWSLFLPAYRCIELCSNYVTDKSVIPGDATARDNIGARLFVFFFSFPFGAFASSARREL